MLNISKDLWQEATLQTIVSFLNSDEDVQALFVIGSLADNSHSVDAWSDIDLVLVVADLAFSRFYPTLTWLTFSGEIYAYEQQADDFSSVNRICLTDLRRLDFVFIKLSNFNPPEKWVRPAFWKNPRLLFSRSELVTQALASSAILPFVPAAFTNDQFDTLANNFWFKAIVATNKVKRNDLLIAMHLSLELIQDCFVLGMVLRDQATGTTHHREGGLFNQLVAELEVTHQGYSAEGILNSLEQIAIAFDKLGLQWSETYQARRFPLLNWIEFTRQNSGK